MERRGHEAGCRPSREARRKDLGMRIGFYTSTFNDRPIEEVLDFAKEAGFDAIELDVNGHIRSPDNVAPVVLKARERGLFVCSITFFGNQLDPDAGRRSACMR
jgi:sugar phosphate isomerase/epimerase